MWEDEFRGKADLTWDQKVRLGICLKCNNKGVKLCGIREICWHCTDELDKNKRIDSWWRRASRDDD